MNPPDTMPVHDKVNMLRNPMIDAEMARKIKQELMWVDINSLSAEDYHFLLNN